MGLRRTIARLLIATLLAASIPSPYAFSQAAPAPNFGAQAPTQLPAVLFQEAPRETVPENRETNPNAVAIDPTRQNTTPAIDQAHPGGPPALGQELRPQDRAKETMEFANVLLSNIDEYVLGPGDRFSVHIIVGDNALNFDYSFSVGLEGKIFFPAIGEITAAGFKFRDFKNHLRKVIRKKFKESFQLSVELLDIRSIKVYFAGHVDQFAPRYVSALARIEDVIESVGIAPGGSSRFVTIRRIDGEIIKIDLYDYFRKGNLSANVPLKAGDVLEIPPAADMDAVQGAVYKPGTYEMKNGETVQDLLSYAGGLTRDAIWGKAILLNKDNEKKISAVTMNIPLSDRDLLYIPRQNIKVQIIGEVDQPGIYDLYAGQTLRDLIKVSGGLKKSGALQEVVYLTRKIGKDIFEDSKLNVYKLLYEGDESQNVTLEDGDIVTIPSIELYVYIYGEVGSPGRLPYIPGRKLSDYLHQAGGPNSRANLARVAISRFKEGRSQVVRVDAEAILTRGQKEKDVSLKGGDVVFVPGRFFYFNDFNSLANLIFTGATLYGLFFRR